MAPSPRKLDTEELRNVRDRELELRRLSGEVSCADCRRLKLKCDKKIPCSSCVRRGAEKHCPLGVVGRRNQSARESLAFTSCHCSLRWKRKLVLLSERIRTLEDALSVESEARGGFGSHPLLMEELLAIKQSMNDGEGEDGEVEEEGDELSGSFGTLSIDESRTMRYLGPAASDTALLMEVLENSAHRSPTTSSPTDSGCLAQEIINSSKSFLFGPLSVNQEEDALFSQLVSYIPPYERATALYEAFFTNLSWLISPIERSHFVSEIIPLFYPDRKAILPKSVPSHHAHDLALLFVLFACGAVGDLTQHPLNNEATRYHTLAKAALGVKSIMHGASLAGVQTLLLLAAYNICAGEKRNQEDTWKLISLGCSMAAATGLHRDPSRWGFDTKMTQRRRRAFWEIYVSDNWASLETGRPPSFRPSDVDCEFPSDIFATIGEDGEAIESVTNWRFRFMRDIGSEVCGKLTSARPLKYRDVLELDRKIREFAAHPSLSLLNHRPSNEGFGQDEESRRIYPLFTAWTKEEYLMLVHRNFFAKAIIDFPDNPMRSPFAASFLTTFRCASTVIRMCRENMHTLYPIILRVWHVWSLCLLSGVIVGTVASLGSSVSFANSAFVELERTIKLFEKFSGHKVAKHGLPLLLRIRQKAMAGLCQPQTRQRTSAGQRTLPPATRKETEDTDDELLILRGATRVVDRHKAIPPSHDGVGSSAGSPGNLSDLVSSLPSEETSQSQQHAVSTGIHDTRSSWIAGQQSSGVFHVPETDPDAWLAQLEGMFELSPDLHVLDGYALQTASDLVLSFDASNLPIPDLDGDVGMVGSSHELPLNETVSTGEWRQLMRQSGFSSTPPFDFALDSSASCENSSTPDWPLRSRAY